MKIINRKTQTPITNTLYKLSLILTIALAFVLFYTVPVCATGLEEGEIVKIEGVHYKVVGDELHVVGVDPGVTRVELTCSYTAGQQYNVTVIESGAFSNNEDLEEVIVCGYIRRIEATAFKNCPNLKTITIKEGVYYLGTNAFSHLDSLEEIYIPDSVKEFDFMTFYEVKNLKKVSIPVKNVSMTSSSLDGLEDDAVVTVRGSICELDQTGIVTSNENIVFTGNSTHDFAYSAENEEMVDGVKYVTCACRNANCWARYTFGFTPDFETGTASLSDCNINLRYWNVRVNVMNYVSFQNENNTTVSLPVTEVGMMACQRAYKLRKVKLPTTLKVIGAKAFERCSGLNEVILPDGLEKIEMGAFDETYNLKSMTIPKTVKYIGIGGVGMEYDINTNAYEPVKDFVISGYCQTEAERYAADNNINFRHLDTHVEKTDDDDDDSHISPDKPDTGDTSGNNSATGTTDDSGNGTITGGSSTSTGNNSASTAGGEEIKVGATVKVGSASYVIGKNGTVTYKKPNKKMVTKVTIPATVKINSKTYKVTAIAANAFKGNTKLTKVTIGKNVASIGKKAFYGCKKLKSITIKTSKLKASKVGSKAFGKINAKAKVKVPKKKVKTYKAMLKKKGLSGKKQKVTK